MHIRTHPVVGAPAENHPADTAEVEFDNECRARRVVLRKGQGIVGTFRADDLRYLTAEPKGATFKAVTRFVDGSEKTYDATDIAFVHNVLNPSEPLRRRHYVEIAAYETRLDVIEATVA